MKELLKSDSICESYAQMKKGPVFFTHSVYHAANRPTVNVADLPRQQWSLLNRFRTEQGHGACRRKWRLAERPRRCPTLSNPVL